MTGPTTPALAAALAKVQAELPKLERDRTVEVTQKNGQTYSYSYITLANLSDAILPLLAKHGLSFAAMPGAGADGKMCVRYHLLHSSGEQLSGEFPISGEGGIQMIGGRITYARRYCLAAVVGVAADEDDESRLTEDGAPRTAQRAATRQAPARAASKAQQPVPESKTAQRASRPPAGSPPLPGEEAADPNAITKAQLTKLHILMKETGFTDRDEALAYLAAKADRQIASSKELTKDEARLIIDALESLNEPPAEGGDAA
jgi:ERF superfamily protein